MDVRRQLTGLLMPLAAMLLLSGCGSAEPTPTATTEEAVQASTRSAPRVPAGPPRVRLATTQGDIVVELDAEHAPLTVANFLNYVDSRHYDGTIFHQVVDDYVILGGAYTPDLVERPSRTPVRNEAHNGLKNLRGTIAMARDRASIDSSTCQFFINLHDNEALDHTNRTADEYGYCVFGRVVEGMDIIDRLAKVETRDTEAFEMIPVTPVVIRTARREGTDSPRQARAATGTVQR